MIKHLGWLCALYLSYPNSFTRMETHPVLHEMANIQKERISPDPYRSYLDVFCKS